MADTQKTAAYCHVYQRAFLASRSVLWGWKLINLDYYYCYVASLRRMDLASLRDFVLSQGLGIEYGDDVHMRC